jgi:hypothetical protein
MYLTKKQADKFYKIFHSLIFYTIEEFNMLDDPSVPGGKKPYTDYFATEVANTIWADSSIIDKYVKDNPEKLNSDELRIVSEWKHHVSGLFYMVKHTGGRTVMLQDGYAFGIVGISEDIAEMCPELPMAVEVTLLPFEGKIVYDGAFAFYSFSFGPGIKKEIENELKEIATKGSIVTTESDFIETAKQIADEKRSEKAKSEKETVTSKKKTDGDIPEIVNESDNSHMGILSGLPDEEREQAIKEHISDASEALENAFERVAIKTIYRRPPVSSLKACLNVLTKKNLIEIAYDCDLYLPSASRKDEYVEELTKELPGSYLTKWFLTHLTSSMVAPLNELADAGGQLNFSDKDTSSILKYCIYKKPYVMVFHYNHEYTVVMPDEIVGIYTDNRNKLTRTATLKDELKNYADALTTVYGIVSVDDFLHIFNKNRTEQIDMSTLIISLIQIKESLVAGYRIWEPGDEIYIVHYLFEFEEILEDDEFYEDFAEEYYNAQTDGKHFAGTAATADTEKGLYIDVVSVGADSDEDDDYSEEDIDELDISSDDIEYMEHIRSRHEKILMKPLKAAELLKYADDEQIYNQPAMVNMRNFFDANIPPNKDDYLFADKMAENLLQMFRFEASVQQIVDFLANSDLDFEIDKTKDMFSFIMDAANNIPKWVNNGWSAMELSRMQNKDGEIDYNFAVDSPDTKSIKAKKTGRNEPCPCGSGKKYKNCCGKS